MNRTSFGYMCASESGTIALVNAQCEHMVVLEIEEDNCLSEPSFMPTGALDYQAWAHHSFGFDGRRLCMYNKFMDRAFLCDLDKLGAIGRRERRRERRQALSRSERAKYHDLAPMGVDDESSSDDDEGLMSDDCGIDEDGGVVSRGAAKVRSAKQAADGLLFFPVYKSKKASKRPRKHWEDEKFEIVEASVACVANWGPTFATGYSNGSVRVCTVPDPEADLEADPGMHGCCSAIGLSFVKWCEYSAPIGFSDHELVY